MRDDSFAFGNKNTEASKSPRFTIEIAFDNAATDLLYLTSHADGEAPSASIAASEVIFGVVRGISGQSQSLDPINAVATIGSFSFEVIDKNDALTVYMRDRLDAGDGLRHKRIKCYVGFQDLEWSDYSNVLTFIIDGINYRDGVYRFNCSDIQRETREQIFIPDECYLSASVTATATKIPCTETNAAKFKAIAHDASYTDNPSTYAGYGQIEDEIFSHSGIAFDTTTGWHFQVIERGALNSRAAEHVLDENAASDRAIKIKEHVFLEGPAPKIIYALLTGNLYNQFDASSPPVQETLPDNWHLGIDTGFVKLSDFIGIGDDLWNTLTLTGRQVRLDGPKKTDGKKFIERELLLWLGCYMPVYSTGELGLRRLSPVLSDSSYLAALDETNIASYSDLKHDMSQVINNLSIDWNHVFLKDEYTKTASLLDAGSIATYNQAPAKEIELFAVHTGAHTDEDIASYFDTMRDRYSAPPLKLSIEVLPSLNFLEVGDTVRVQLDQIRDFNDPSATTIDRVFEIQRVQTNWMTGEVRLDLFGSAQKAGTLTKTTLSTVLDDIFYTSEGTELSTVLTISGGAVTANGSLTGASTMASGIYYYDGDLTINAGVTVTIANNVQLRIKGSLTINGTIDGAGNGILGGAGATQFTATGTAQLTYPQYISNGIATNEADGTAGYLGYSQAQSGVLGYYDRTVIQALTPLAVTYASASVPFFNVRNYSTYLTGLPTDLRGSSGGGGGAGIIVTTRDPTGSPQVGHVDLVAQGGSGGASGAGLMIIARGVSFGASGSIDTSGAIGSSGQAYEHYLGFTIYGGSGAAGAPGGLVILLDGNSTPPNLTDEHVAIYQNTPIFGNTFTGQINALSIGNVYSSGNIGIHNIDMGSSAYSLQFIPESSAVTEEVDPPPPDVTNFIVGLSGSTVIFRWKEVIDNNLLGYEIRYSKQTVTDWDSAIPLTQAAAGTRITDTAIIDGDWRFHIKAIDENGQYSQNSATYDITVTSPFDIIESSQEDPDWLGTKTYFVKHWTGKLIPQSQDSDSTGIDLSLQTIYNVYPLCIYETQELDVLFDDSVRAWIESGGELMPSQTGIVSIANYIDYKTAAGSYDGWEEWIAGEINARYIKFKLELDTTQGIAFIDACQIVADLLERKESGNNIAISASGESIVFDRAFHTTPIINVQAISGSPDYALPSNITTSGFDIDYYNNSGTQISGNVNWRAEGV